MAHMFHQVSFAIIEGKWWAIKMPLHLSTLYLSREWLSCDSLKCSAHGIQGYTRVPMLVLITMLPYSFVRPIS